MSIFDEIMQMDAANAFSGANDFGESVTYRDRDGAETTFMAQVFRTPPAIVPDSRGLDLPPKPMPELMAFLPLDPAGVAGVKRRPDPGGVEYLTIAEVYGECPRRFPIVSVPSSDAGGFMVKLK